MEGLVWYTIADGEQRPAIVVNTSTRQTVDGKPSEPESNLFVFLDAWDREILGAWEGDGPDPTPQVRAAAPGQPFVTISGVREGTDAGTFTTGRAGDAGQAPASTPAASAPPEPTAAAAPGDTATTSPLTAGVPETAPLPSQQPGQPPVAPPPSDWQQPVEPGVGEPAPADQQPQ